MFLGIPFVRNFYTVFDYTNNTVSFGVNTANDVGQSIGPKNNDDNNDDNDSTSSSLSTGAIVGIVLGSVGFLVILMAVCYCCYRKRQDKTLDIYKEQT